MDHHKFERQKQYEHNERTNSWTVITDTGTSRSKGWTLVLSEEFTDRPDFAKWILHNLEHSVPPLNNDQHNMFTRSIQERAGRINPQMMTQLPFMESGVVLIKKARLAALWGGGGLLFIVNWAIKCNVVCGSKAQSSKKVFLSLPCWEAHFKNTEWVWEHTKTFGGPASTIFKSGNNFLFLFYAFKNTSSLPGSALLKKKMKHANANKSIHSKPNERQLCSLLPNHYISSYHSEPTTLAHADIICLSPETECRRRGKAIV